MTADAETAATDGGSGPVDDDSGSSGLAAPSEHPEWLTLDEGEEIRWVGQPATASVIPSFAWGIVLLPVVGLGLLVMVSSYLSLSNTDYVVTNTTLYHKQGILSTNIESVGLDRIQNTEYSQSFSGKQLGYGTIEISTAGSSGSDVTFRAIDDPGPVRDLVNELTRAAIGAGTGGAGGRSSADGSDATPAAAGGGVDRELLADLHSELRAVNESMQNVERLLREEREGGAGVPGSGRAPERDGASGNDGASGTETTTGESGSASDFVSTSPSSSGSDDGSTGGSVDGADDDVPPTPFGGDDGG